MKNLMRIGFSICMIVVLNSFAKEEVNKETLNQITPLVVNENNINEEIKSSIFPTIRYISDIDGTVDVEIDLISDSNKTNNMTVKELKEMIIGLKKDSRINKVLLDLEVSTVNDFKEKLLLKRELDFEKKKVQTLSTVYEEDIKNIRTSISESSPYILILVFSLGVIGTLYIQLEIDSLKRRIEKEQRPISYYILGYVFKIFIAICLILIVIKIINYVQ